MCKIFFVCCKQKHYFRFVYDFTYRFSFTYICSKIYIHICDISAYRSLYLKIRFDTVLQKFVCVNIQQCKFSFRCFQLTFHGKIFCLALFEFLFRCSLFRDKFFLSFEFFFQKFCLGIGSQEFLLQKNEIRIFERGYYFSFFHVVAFKYGYFMY